MRSSLSIYYIYIYIYILVRASVHLFYLHLLANACYYCKIKFKLILKIS